MSEVLDRPAAAAKAEAAPAALPAGLFHEPLAQALAPEPESASPVADWQAAQGRGADTVDNAVTWGVMVCFGAAVIGMLALG